jgi:hypothetical protein
VVVCDVVVADADVALRACRSEPARFGGVVALASERAAARRWWPWPRVLVDVAAELGLVVAAAAPECPENPRAARAANVSSSAVAAPAIPRLVRRSRRKAASRRRCVDPSGVRMAPTVADGAKRPVT